MSSLPSWVEEAIRNRFDEVAAFALKTCEIKKANSRFREVLYAYQATLSGKGLDLFMELEETWNHANSLEKERLYHQGVKDGAVLLFSLLPRNDSLSRGT